MAARSEVGRLQVPQVSIDLKGDLLNGKQKLTVVKYALLEEQLHRLGRQRFTPQVFDNLPLRDVRDWFVQQGQEDFQYDFAAHNLPITFRTALGVGLLTTRLTDHLSSVGEVEVYASRNTQQALQEQKVDVGQGLSKLDYAALPADAKRLLIEPLIDNLRQARSVAQAGLLFPSGIKQEALMFADPGFLMMRLFEHWERGSDIKFDELGDLDLQAHAAEIAQKNYLQFETFEQLGEELRIYKEQGGEVDEEVPAVNGKTTSEDYDVMYDQYGERRYPDFAYPEGTTLFDVFPLKSGETPDDVARAYQRLTQGRFYRGRVESDDFDGYFNVILKPDGSLIGIHGSRGSWDGERYSTNTQRELNLLSERYERDYDDRFRRQNVGEFLEELREEIDTNTNAVRLAEAHLGTTSVLAEQGFVEVMSNKSFPALTPSERAEMKQLVKEAKQTISEKDDEPSKEETSDIVVFSNKPVDDNAVTLDRLILRAIKKHHGRVLTRDMLSFAMGMNSYQDNIGDWFTGSSEMLREFQGVMIDAAGLFRRLGIEPTTDIHKIEDGFREIARNSHPDKTTSLSPEERVAAAERFLLAKEAQQALKTWAETGNTGSLAAVYHLGRISELFNKETSEDQQSREE